MRACSSRLACLTWMIALLAGIPTAGAATRIPGHVPDALQGARRDADARVARGGDPLTLTVVLKREQQEAFGRWLRDLYDPASSAYRRYLRPEALADRFGPTRSAYERVRAHLVRQGFRVVRGSKNRLTLTIEGTRTVAERAFDVTIDDYARGSRTFFANGRDPALPDALAPHVAAIVGLSSLPRPHASIEGIQHNIAKAICYVKLGAMIAERNHQRIIQDKPQLTFAEQQALARKCYAAERLALEHGRPPNAIDPPPPSWVGIDGLGQTVGLLQFDTFETSDVADYMAWLGIPAGKLADVTAVHVNGGASPGPNEEEVLLDIAAVLTVAPGAKIRVYDAPFTGRGTSFQSLFNAMIDDGVDIISNSWAYCEDQTTLADVQSIDAILATAAAAGISVFNASGDTGSTCLNGAANTVAVPASSPNATAVGGTSLTDGPGFTYGSETWWNGVADTPPTGQGGFGVSKFFPRPSYQDGFTVATGRSVPDVAVNADPANGIMICQASKGGCPTGLYFGGTSAAAPIWAGFTALLNQAQGANLGLLNPVIYPFAATGAFNGPASMGSDFAHVGIGSPNLYVLHQLLTNTSPGAVSTAQSVATAFVNEFPSPLAGVDSQVPADGVATGQIVVRLLDDLAYPVPGQTVSLTASPSGTVVVDPPNAVTPARDGVVVFTAKNLVAETVTFTVHVSGGITLPNQPHLVFAVPPAASAGIDAQPTSVLANGTEQATVTVTLEDGLGRPAPGKRVVLSQGSGHSAIVAPDPPVTGGDGKIQFVVTNRVAEAVTYSAIVVTDGNVPVPGNAVVTFTGSTTSCVGAPAVGQNGYTVTPYLTGFRAENFSFGNINWGGCPGASSPAFRGSDVFVAGFRLGELYRFGLAGGAASTANVVGTSGPTLGYPVFGKDGRLYAAFGAKTDAFSGSIVELDPETGAVVRTLASNQKCPSGLAVDPLSGDLFFLHQCFGSPQDASLHRVRNPASPTPTVEVYVTLAASPNGMLAFAPNGSIYVPIGYTQPNPPIVRVSGTNVAGPPTVTTIPGATSIFTMTLGSVDATGEATSLIGSTVDGLALFDITTSPATRTIIAENMGGGIIGPDGCLYAGVSDTVYKVARTDGSCDFAPTSAAPSLRLEPAVTVPDPPQGTSQTLTASFRNLDVPEGTPVFFQVTGASIHYALVRTDANGTASFTYTSLTTGLDEIVAEATVDGETFTSNAARVTWVSGKHLTALRLDPAAKAGLPGQVVTVSATLSDLSADPLARVEGVTIEFTLGGAQCSAVTDADGVATCQVTAGDPGIVTLTATFAGTPGLVETSTASGFTIVGTGLGAFTVYQAPAAKTAPKLFKLGPVTLTDALGSAGYEVLKGAGIGIPADVNGGGVPDPDVDLAAYAVKRAKGAAKFVAVPDVAVANQCGAMTLTLVKPKQLLVPATAASTGPVSPPVEADHELDHFLCYKVKVPKKRSDGTVVPPFPKKAQVDVTDGIQTRRYDLKKIVTLCLPVAKSGTPTLLAGPNKGAPFPLTPATVRHAASQLLCYSAKPATKTYAQSGCGATNSKDKGVAIVPKPAKHAATALAVADQLQVTSLVTKKESLVCLPTTSVP